MGYPERPGRREPQTRQHWASTREAVAIVFGISSPVKPVRPVRFAPGRFRLATRPDATGSTAAPKTIGMEVVAAFPASASEAPEAAITATRRRTRQGARGGGGLLAIQMSRVETSTTARSRQWTQLRRLRALACMGFAHGQPGRSQFPPPGVAENSPLQLPSGSTIEVILLFQTRCDISSSVGMRLFGVR
jgi:hypothetical protein